jgi:protein SCO1
MPANWRLVLGAALSLFPAVAGAAAFADEAPPQILSATTATHIGGPFSLTSADGKRITDRSFPGQWLLIYFGYTFCPDACPTALSAMSAALAEIGPDARKIQPIFVTVDPQRDTPQILAQYVKNFDPRLIALLGSPAEIAAVAKEYRVYYAVQPLGNNEYAIDHSSFIYVIDPKGQVVELLTGDVPGHRIADELRRSLK